MTRRPTSGRDHAEAPGSLVADIASSARQEAAGRLVTTACREGGRSPIDGHGSTESVREAVEARCDDQYSPAGSPVRHRSVRIRSGPRAVSSTSTANRRRALPMAVAVTRRSHLDDARQIASSVSSMTSIDGQSCRRRVVLEPPTRDRPTWHVMGAGLFGLRPPELHQIGPPTSRPNDRCGRSATIIGALHRACTITECFTWNATTR